jgi:hypothetical protein
VVLKYVLTAPIYAYSTLQLSGGVMGKLFYLLAKENEKSEIPKCSLFLLSNKVKN